MNEYQVRMEKVRDRVKAFGGSMMPDRNAAYGGAWVLYMPADDVEPFEFETLDGLEAFIALHDD